MKEKIERLSKGIFEYEQPEIVLSQDVLDVFLSEGENCSGSFVISNSANTTMKGLLYSSSNIVKLDSKTFNGVSNEITYTVTSGHMEQGERTEGRIDIISDCGERQLPFTISVLGTTCRSSVGRINNFFSFQSLAQANWNEALELFDSKPFYDAVIKNDDGLKCAYETLKASPDRNMAMEEFLFSHKKKPECSFFVGTSEITADVDPISFMEKVVITKSNWGYLKLKAESDVPFILPSKNVIDNNDFINGRFELRFIVNLEGARPCVRRGNITIGNALHEVVIPVTYRVRDNDEKRREKNLTFKKFELSLMDRLMGYRCGRTERHEFLAESVKLAETLEHLLDREAEENAAQGTAVSAIREYLPVYRAFLATLADRNSMNDDIIALTLLKKRDYEQKNPELYAALLYIEALYVNTPEIRKQNSEAIRALYERDRDNAWMLVMYMYLDQGIRDNYRLRYEYVKKLIDQGNNSPLLLSEAGLMVKNDPGLLRKAGKEECRILLYMTENSLVNDRVISEFVYLSRHNEKCDRLQLRVLERFHEISADKDLLAAICLKIVCADLRDRRYHVYFREAVAAQLSFVNIFEYYMYTYGTDNDEPIDQPVLLYFGYNSALPEDLMAVLFAYVVKNKEENKAIYRAYLKNIEQFAVNSLKNRKIDRILATIYADVLNRSILDSELVNAVPDVLFTSGVDVPPGRFREVVVTNNLEMNEGRYEIVDGHANVLCYTDSCTCWLEDEEGNRYVLRDDCRCVRYLHMQDLLANCYDEGAVNPRLLLYMWEKNRGFNQSDNSYITLQKQISGIRTLKPEIANVCFYNLAEYYYDNYEGELLEAYLADVDIRLLSAEQRNKVVELMIVRNMYDKVIEYVKEFGCEKLALKRLSKLCLQAVESPREAEDRETIVAMSHFAFRNGGVDDRLLKYIVDNFNGTTLEMYEIWNAAKQENLDTLKLEENLLAQILFTETYIENTFAVFKSYYFKNNNRKLVRAFISYTAYKYFVCLRVTEDEFFDVLKADPSLENSRIGILALLKHYSEKEVLTAEEKEFADSHVRQLLQKKVFYAFFKDFGNKLSLPDSLLEKFYIEYRTDPKKMVYIHYSYDRGNEFKAEVMPDVGYGIFTKEFILFHGDVLQYFITESDGEGEEITESDAISCPKDPTGGRMTTKYDKINNILMAAEAKDDKAVLQYLEQYYFTEYAIKRHFKPL
ncbi:MAG: DUF5717 family protein [Lachnospiraceae bacterium]|nr:DUF5717 family protein [Lachnospiraceae bacterium]